MQPNKAIKEILDFVKQPGTKQPGETQSSADIRHLRSVVYTAVEVLCGCEAALKEQEKQLDSADEDRQGLCGEITSLKAQHAMLERRCCAYDEKLESQPEQDTGDDNFNFIIYHELLKLHGRLATEKCLHGLSYLQQQTLDCLGDLLDDFREVEHPKEYIEVTEAPSAPTVVRKKRKKEGQRKQTHAVKGVK